MNGGMPHLSFEVKEMEMVNIWNLISYEWDFHKISQQISCKTSVSCITALL